MLNITVSEILSSYFLDEKRTDHPSSWCTVACAPLGELQLKMSVVPAGDDTLWKYDTCLLHRMCIHPIPATDLSSLKLMYANEAPNISCLKSSLTSKIKGMQFNPLTAGRNEWSYYSYLFPDGCISISEAPSPYRIWGGGERRTFHLNPSSLPITSPSSQIYLQRNITVRR